MTLPVLLPVFLIVSLLVKYKIGSPILFKQERPGLYGKPFKMFKFRTMTNEVDADGKLLPDAQRMTSFGLFLRSTSLDELPELINVLKGDMSIVGPRPLLMQYLPLYNEHQKIRHDVKPGITGWAQINGRNSLSWPEKFDLDVWYVNHQNYILDLSIMLKTCFKVLAREDISADDHVTVEPFQGNERK